MKREITLPAGIKIDAELMEFPATQTAGLDIEKLFMSAQGIPDERYLVLAGLRSGFEREFKVQPQMYSVPKGRVTAVPVYYIPDLVERTRDTPFDFHPGRASDTAFFYPHRPDPYSLQAPLRALSLEASKSMLGVVHRLAPMIFGLATDGNHFWRAVESVDTTLEYALGMARMTHDSKAVDAMISSLGSGLLRIGECGLSAEGLCIKEDYVVKKGRVMFDGVKWTRFLEEAEPASIVEDTLKHAGVLGCLSSFMTNEHEKTVFANAISQRR